MSTARISFGARTARVEGPLLLTGKGRFIDDIALPGTLSAVFVRSPHAHATINSIDTRAARAASGVHAVFTLDDLMPHLSSDRTPLGQSVREIVGLTSRSLRKNITPFVLARDEVCTPFRATRRANVSAMLRLRLVRDRCVGSARSPHPAPPGFR